MMTTRRNMVFNLGIGALLIPSIVRSHKAASQPLEKPRAPVAPRPAPPRVPIRSSITTVPPHHKKVTEHLHKRHHRHPARSAHSAPHSLRAKRTLDTPGNRRDLALTLWGEARNSSQANFGEMGMISVGNVIMNRVKAGEDFFGHGVDGVCHKRKQFSCWNKWDNNFKRMQELPHLPADNDDWKAFEVADRVAGKLLAGIIKDNTDGATFYCASYMVPYWAGDMTIVGVMYGHTFYKPKHKKKHSHDSHHKGHHGRHHHSHSSHHHKSH